MQDFTYSELDDIMEEEEMEDNDDEDAYLSPQARRSSKKRNYASTSAASPTRQAYAEGQNSLRRALSEAEVRRQI